MKTCLLLTFLAISLPTLADDPFPRETEPVPPQDVKIPGWGTRYDLAGDCTFEAAAGVLTVTVPSSLNSHDLSVELGSSTAPRVLRPVAGDFVMTVKVEGEFVPGADSTQTNRTGYTGAGLVLFADERNFARLERAALQRPGQAASPYINYELRVDGTLDRFGLVGDLPVEESEPTWLRLERKGQQLHGAVSQDGKTWSQARPKSLQASAWNRTQLMAGVAAVSTSLRRFKPMFSEFSVQQSALEPVQAPHPPESTSAPRRSRAVEAPHPPAPA